MQICSHHKDTLRGALAERGLRGNDPLFQAESLILQNAFNAEPKLLEAPPHVCPLCRLTLLTAYHWISECARSIAHERKPQ